MEFSGLQWTLIIKMVQLALIYRNLFRRIEFALVYFNRIWLYRIGGRLQFLFLRFVRFELVSLCCLCVYCFCHLVVV